MKATKRILGAVGLAVLSAGLVMAKANDKKMMDKKAAAQPMMSPECIAYMTPGEGQAKLNPFVGTFMYQVKMWMDPAAQPMMMTGKAENKWINGGRHLQEMAKGDPDPNMPGQPPFEGQGIVAYDNFKKEYVSTWADNMATGVMIARGQMTPDGVLNEMGTMPDPMSGVADKPFRTVSRWSDPDTMVYEMYSPGKDGKEFKVMEITYKRVKV